LIKRAIVRMATKEGAAQEPPFTAKEMVEKWLTDAWNGGRKKTLLNGRMVISTSEANGSVTFAVPDGMGVSSLIALLEAILEELEGTHRRIKRLRFTYNIASL